MILKILTFTSWIWFCMIRVLDTWFKSANLLAWVGVSDELSSKSSMLARRFVRNEWSSDSWLEFLTRITGSSLWLWPFPDDWVEMTLFKSSMLTISWKVFRRWIWKCLVTNDGVREVSFTTLPCLTSDAFFFKFDVFRFRVVTRWLSALVVIVAVRISLCFSGVRQTSYDSLSFLLLGMRSLGELLSDFYFRFF